MRKNNITQPLIDAAAEAFARHYGKATAQQFETGFTPEELAGKDTADFIASSRRYAETCAKTGFRHGAKWALAVSIPELAPIVVLDHAGKARIEYAIEREVKAKKGDPLAKKTVRLLVFVGELAEYVADYGDEAPERLEADGDVTRDEAGQAIDAYKTLDRIDTDADARAVDELTKAKLLAAEILLEDQ